jgi:two-component system cell cycle response regulator CtrA
MRVLLIQRDNVQAASNMAMLSAAKFVADRAVDTTEGFAFLRAYEYGIVVLDHILPVMDGCLMIRSMRAESIDTPVLMLTDVGACSVTVSALRAGADDVLVKPVQKDEFIAHIETIIRRSNGHGQSTLQVGPILLDLDLHEASIDGESLEFTGREFAILRLLALRRGRLVAKETILNHIYDGRDDPGSRIIDVFICNIRKKLASFDAGQVIDTVHGKGYLIRESSKSAVPSRRFAPTAVAGALAGAA